MDPTNASSKQLLSAYKSLSTKRLFSFPATGTVSYGGTKLGPVVLDTCPSSAATGSICHKVTATFQLTYKPSDFANGVPPLLDIVQFVQDSIDEGNLDCDLEALFPSSPIKVTDGGGCQK